MNKPDTLIYRTDLIRIGVFRCPPGHPLFEDSGPIGGNLLVFPRTSVCITHAGGEPIVANPNLVMFYNPGQVYRRDKISERGDHCEWFAFDSQVILEALRPFDSKVEDHPGRPFQLTHGLSDPTCYLLQRKVVEHVLEDEQPDPLFVEETMLWVLERTIETAYRRDRQLQQQGRTDQRDLVQAIQALIATRFHEPLSLQKIASELSYSPYYLCRVFHKYTGSTIHHFLTQVRLRTALEWIADSSCNLTDLAMNLGFSSHSHFTMAFHKAFGAPPTRIQNISVLFYHAHPGLL